MAAAGGVGPLAYTGLVFVNNGSNQLVGGANATVNGNSIMVWGGNMATAPLVDGNYYTVGHVSQNPADYSTFPTSRCRLYTHAGQIGDFDNCTH